MSGVVVPTVQVELARVSLDISGVAAFDRYTVERAYASGYTTQVRGLVDVEPLGDAFVGFDYEAPMDTNVAYRIVATTGAVVDEGPWSAYVSWSSTSSYLKDLSRPDRNMAVNVVAVDGVSWEQRIGTYPVLNRRTPVVVLDVRQASQGTISVATLTIDDYWRLLNLVSDGVPLLFQTPQRFGVGNLYVALGTITEQRAGRRGDWEPRTFEMVYVEIDPPSAAGIVGTGQTYADVVEVYVSYQDVLDQEATYLDLLESVGSGQAPSENRPPLLPWRG